MPSASTLLREARSRAGLSQRALAKKAGTSQSVIARIEAGLTSPTWDTLERLLEAANFAVSAQLESRVVGSHMLHEVAHVLSLTPEQRLEGVKNLSRFFAEARSTKHGAATKVAERPAAAPLDPERILRTLAQHQVRFVLIGALAAGLQGFPRATYDADITPAVDPENLQRLAAALRDLEAKIYTEPIPDGLAFDCSAAMLARGMIWNLITAAGRLDIAFRPSGTEGYDDLARQAVHITVYGEPLLAARLEDIIRSKEAAGRPQDRQDVVVMREMLKRR
jgi:transcriptional regulator with XRE-family HTH domain